MNGNVLIHPNKKVIFNIPELSLRIQILGRKINFIYNIKVCLKRTFKIFMLSINQTEDWIISVHLIFVNN